MKQELEKKAEYLTLSFMSDLTWKILSHLKWYAQIEIPSQTD